MPSTDTRELVGELTLAMAEADTMLGWARVRYSVLRDLRDALLRSPVERGEGERKKSDWANPLEAAFYWMSPGADASPEEREEYERDRLFVSAALSTVRLDRQEPDVRDGWEVEHGVICVTCPDCAFTFGAEHRDAGGGYTCPLCASPPAPVEGTREREIRERCSAIRSAAKVISGHLDLREAEQLQEYAERICEEASAITALAALPVQGAGGGERTNGCPHLLLNSEGDGNA
jgi:hypothetical protein